MLSAMLSCACRMFLLVSIAAARALAVQGANPADAAAPSKAAVKLKVGESRVIKPVGGDVGVPLELEVRNVEPLTIFAGSYDCDVSVQVEDAGGGVLGRAEDGGVETDAALPWTPAAPGPVIVRVLAKESAARAGVMVRRGTVRSKPRDPGLAARAYWEIAWNRAQEHKDPIRAEQALAKCADLAGAPRETVEAELVALLAKLGEFDAKLKTVDERNAARDLAGARAALHEGLALLDALHGRRSSDGFEALFVARANSPRRWVMSRSIGPPWTT